MDVRTGEAASGGRRRGRRGRGAGERSVGHGTAGPGGSRSRAALSGALGGFFLGAVFQVLALVVGRVSTGTWSAVHLRRDQPVAWVVDVFPLVLAAAGALLGILAHRLRTIDAPVSRFTRAVVDEWTSRIHDTNAEIARSATSRVTFLAALSHEMRTPLSAIVGFAELIEEDPGDPELTRAMAADVRASASQLLGIIDDLLDAAKLEAGRIELLVVDVDVDALVGDVVRRLAPLVRQKGLQLAVDLAAGVGCRADPQRLRQILVNLLSNAVKYTEEGSIRVRTRATDGVVTVEVEDTGIGIDPQDSAAVFTPFQRTRAARRRADSTGLGLPISLGLAEAMGGTIGFHSEGPGRGTTFTLTLPRATGSVPESRVATLPTPVPASA